MPIVKQEFLEMQQMGRQLGELRFGTTGTSKGGKKIPVKLNTWRFTTRSERTAESVANNYGGKVDFVTLNNSQETYEVLTQVDSLDVIIPPGEAAIDQWMEMWSGGGCQRRCDGVTEQLTQTPCKCPADLEQRLAAAMDGKACKFTTRARVILPDIEGVGTWRVASSGFHAAVELGGDTERLSMAHAQGFNLPATLWLDKRTDVKGGKTFKYVVPCLDIRKSMREIVEIAAGGGFGMADAISASGTPPLSLPSGPRAAIGTGDDDVIDAELVEDDRTRTAPITAPATVTPLGGSVATAPTTAGAPQVQTDSGPALRPHVHAPDEVASLNDMSALQIKRAEKKLTGGPWAKFAAQQLHRSVSPTESTFSAREVEILLAALESES